MEKVGRTIQTGEEIPTLTRTASLPPNPGGRNVIHDNEYAKQQGLRGGLIGGSTLLGYVLQMLYNHFGQNWLHHGKINVSFIGGGAIDGDVLTGHGKVTSAAQEEAGTRLSLDVWLENQTGAKVVVGQASCIQ